MNRLTKLAFMGLALVGMLGLSACGTLVSTSYDMNDDAYNREVTVTMKDGREVPCIRVSDGISCDWDNATVSAPRVPVSPSPAPSK